MNSHRVRHARFYFLPRGFLFFLFFFAFPPAIPEMREDL